MIVGSRWLLATLAAGAVLSTNVAAGTAAGAPATCAPPTVHGKTMRADLVIVGAHEAGFGAAIAAARRCLSVVLVSAEPVIGGMLTAGQIGFTDGLPMISWPDAPGGVNGELVQGASWGTGGGLWNEFRSRVAAAQGKDPARLADGVRYEPRYAARVATAMAAGLKSLRVLTSTNVVDAKMAGDHVAYADVQGAFTGRLEATYWVDGSDGGTFIGTLGLPSAIGSDVPGTAAGNGSVQSYSYRWTAIEGDVPGAFPVAPPPYYRVTLTLYRGMTSHMLPIWEGIQGVAPGATYLVNPFRFFDNQGRLSGALDDLGFDPKTGAVTTTAPEVWDVNAGDNDARSIDIAAMLATASDVTALFARDGIADPYLGPSPQLPWADIDWVQDRAPIPAADKAFLVGKIEDAVKDVAFGLLWYIRSGDMLSRLHQLPGGQHLSLRSHWSIDNELGTPDGLPWLMYEREGRRVVSERTETIYDLCPSYDADRSIGRGCVSPPHYFQDGIAVGDYNLDIHNTGAAPPYSFALPRPRQVSFRALIPRGTEGLLVGAAIGADHLAYNALRTGPLRLMIGNAIGEAVAQAKAQHQLRFQDLDVERLRETLAADGQQTFFVSVAPTSNGVGFQNVAIGRTIQKLVARDVLVHDWLPDVSQGTAILAPGLVLNGENAARLTDTVQLGSCLCTTLPWSDLRTGVLPARKLVPGAGRRPATVADAYAWLLKNSRPD